MIQNNSIRGFFLVLGLSFILPSQIKAFNLPKNLSTSVMLEGSATTALFLSSCVYSYKLYSQECKRMGLKPSFKKYFIFLKDLVTKKQHRSPVSGAKTLGLLSAATILSAAITFGHEKYNQKRKGMLNKEAYEIFSNEETIERQKIEEDVCKELEELSQQEIALGQHLNGLCEKFKKYEEEILSKLVTTHKDKVEKSRIAVQSFATNSEKQDHIKINAEEDKARLALKELFEKTKPQVRKSAEIILAQQIKQLVNSEPAEYNKITEAESRAIEELMNQFNNSKKQLKGITTKNRRAREDFEITERRNRIQIQTTDESNESRERKNIHEAFMRGLSELAAQETAKKTQPTFASKPNENVPGNVPTIDTSSTIFTENSQPSARQLAGNDQVLIDSSSAPFRPAENSLGSFMIVNPEDVVEAQAKVPQAATLVEQAQAGLKATVNAAGIVLEATKTAGEQAKRCLANTGRDGLRQIAVDEPLSSKNFANQATDDRKQAAPREVLEADQPIISVSPTSSPVPVELSSAEPSTKNDEGDVTAANKKEKTLADGFDFVGSNEFPKSEVPQTDRVKQAKEALATTIETAQTALEPVGTAAKKAMTAVGTALRGHRELGADESLSSENFALPKPTQPKTTQRARSISPFIKNPRGEALRMYRLSNDEREIPFEERASVSNIVPLRPPTKQEAALAKNARPTVSHQEYAIAETARPTVGRQDLAMAKKAQRLGGPIAKIARLGNR